MKIFTSPTRRISGAICAVATALILSIPAVAQEQEAKTIATPDAGWCATPQMMGALAAKPTRSHQGTVTAFDSETKVLKVKVEYQLVLDDKTTKSDFKNVDVVLTPRTILQKVGEQAGAPVTGKATATTKVEVLPLQSNEIKVGQRVAFSFALPLEKTSTQIAANTTEPPTRVEATAVFVRESDKLRAE